MASDKRKKKPSDTASAAAQPAACPSSPVELSPATSATDGISKSVFFLSVGLALVLGLFVGSLIPPRLASAPETAAPGTAPAPAPQAAAQAPSTQPPAQPSAPAQPPKQPSAPDRQPPIPAELAAKIAGLEQAVLQEPGNPRPWTELGNLYFDTGQPRKAASAYERSLALAPDNADVLTDLGIMYRELDEFEKAVANFRRASSVNPRHENAMFNEGVVLFFDLHRKDDAMKAWQRLLAVNPAARAPDGRPVSDILRTLR
ncbi:MAG: tetratricopeptide repeat protein [Desulfovibrio desulfuricans]|nr:tetratricopeptide repeat protein [Desulfovibrio desulfuricans]